MEGKYFENCTCQQVNKSKNTAGKQQSPTFLLRRNSNLNFWRFLLNYFRSVFPCLLLFSWLSTVLFIGREIHESIPISKMFFTFLQKNFFGECLQSTAPQTSSGSKRQEFWCKTHTPLWLLIGCIIFLTLEKASFAILIGRILYSRLENINHFSDWLELICVGTFMTLLFGDYFSVVQVDWWNWI